tara:strand:- start:14520 stop:14771 length:252 start_codon:yes stop_codon:yes gene_type:complete
MTFAISEEFSLSIKCPHCEIVEEFTATSERDAFIQAHASLERCAVPSWSAFQIKYHLVIEETKNQPTINFEQSDFDLPHGGVE